MELKHIDGRKLYITAHSDVRVPRHRVTIRGSWREPAPLHRSLLQHFIVTLKSKPRMEPDVFPHKNEFTHPRVSKVNGDVEFVAVMSEDKNISVNKTFSMTVI